MTGTPRKTLSAEGVALGVIVGAAAGGGAVAVEAYLLLAVFGWVGGPPPTPDAFLQALIFGLALIVYIGPVAGAVFAVGLMIVGLPAWALLHALHWRSRRVATAAGAVLAATATGILTLAGNASSVGSAGLFALLLLLPGAAAGWALHRASYGRAP